MRLELTNRCNLSCLHCYAQSGQLEGKTDILSEEDYSLLLRQIFPLGCRKVQFIGGEPTLNSSLSYLVEKARAKGFELVGFFANLTHLPERLLDQFRKCGVHVATSFYSWDPVVHDRVTQHAGSQLRTVRNIRRLLAANIPLRVGIVLMEQTVDDFAFTKAFLITEGVLLALESVPVRFIRETCDACKSRTTANNPGICFRDCVIALPGRAF